MCAYHHLVCTAAWYVLQGMTLQSVVDRLQAMGDGSIAANFRKWLGLCAECKHGSSTSHCSLSVLYPALKSVPVT